MIHISDINTCNTSIYINKLITKGGNPRNEEEYFLYFGQVYLFGQCFAKILTFCLTK